MAKKTIFSKSFGSYVRKLRTEKDIGQRELAKKNELKKEGYRDAPMTPRDHFMKRKLGIKGPLNLLSKITKKSQGRPILLVKSRGPLTPSFLFIK